jgi:hypothetical protein
LERRKKKQEQMRYDRLLAWQELSEWKEDLGLPPVGHHRAGG